MSGFFTIKATKCKSPNTQSKTEHEDMHNLVSIADIIFGEAKNDNKKRNESSNLFAWIHSFNDIAELSAIHSILCNGVMYVNTLKVDTGILDRWTIL